MQTVYIQPYLILSAVLFTLGAVGVLLRRNFLTVLMCIELMLNAVNLAFIAFSRLHAAADGQVFALYVIAVAAAEAAIGLGLAVALYTRRGTLEVDCINLLRGYDGEVSAGDDAALSRDNAPTAASDAGKGAPS